MALLRPDPSHHYRFSCDSPLVELDPRLTEPCLHNAADLCSVHTTQAQPVERASFSRKVLAGHALNNLDKSVDRRDPHSCRHTQCAHRDQAGWHVFGDEFVIERFWRTCCLMGAVAVVGEALTGFDEGRFAHAIDAIEPIGQSRYRGDGHALGIYRLVEPGDYRGHTLGIEF